ncbi:hypothetical protein AB0E67_20685 [Streptomyces sp. NPDC032161]|uniref:hypothetical protein n=1 Tax=unclassified Streptomyces TaxID=2593676 RepID=UPI0033E34337
MPRLRGRAPLIALVAATAALAAGAASAGPLLFPGAPSLTGRPPSFGSLPGSGPDTSGTHPQPIADLEHHESVPDRLWQWD